MVSTSRNCNWLAGNHVCGNALTLTPRFNHCVRPVICYLRRITCLKFERRKLWARHATWACWVLTQNRKGKLRGFPKMGSGNRLLANDVPLAKPMKIVNKENSTWLLQGQEILKHEDKNNRTYSRSPMYIHGHGSPHSRIDIDSPNHFPTFSMCLSRRVTLYSDSSRTASRVKFF